MRSIVRSQHVGVAMQNADSSYFVLLDEIRDLAPFIREPGPIVVQPRVTLAIAELLLRARREHDGSDGAVEVRLSGVNVDPGGPNPGDRADPKNQRTDAVGAQ